MTSVSILQLLIQFVFRLSFGVALAMGLTSARWVSSGFFRVHLWVLMGLNTLAALGVYTRHETLERNLGNVSPLLGFAIGLAVASYVGSVIWLYERPRAGYACLFSIVAAALLASVLATPAEQYGAPSSRILAVGDVATSGLVLGLTLSGMFLGHWYLNTPTMELRPLKRLVLGIMGALVLRGVCSGLGLAWHARSAPDPETAFWIFVCLRWLAGLLGPFLLAWMTWWTLKIPNTQSATGILYACVILVFIGELTSQFLSADSLYPL